MASKVVLSDRSPAAFKIGRVSDGDALGFERIGEEAPFERVVGLRCGVELEVPFSVFADYQANLFVANFDNVCTAHELSLPPKRWPFHLKSADDFLRP